ncbi:MAG: FKBP-type peptidyl-prolyl cis-trans isomerase [Paludibacter sp.]|nr:FKBP-type peptidyl-prolyl cis-trans isomerase [Paludibacter sp.]MBP6635177.1 FKBP-type peptidyl-prolyl cis-trans isomerase [Paludibacter sp.]MBP8023279.1 FKBP-type peptidyl-prolyl cis-trans isomerase [Paludibacter sp.]MBP8782640.1 FKBP-type peptidyl-prolyl cis-trans isomerase [Paludibacter sp.]
MKKLNIFLVVAVIAASVLSSCNSNSTKMPSLKNQIDSLNYAFGLANGNGIKQYYLAADSANADSLNAKIESLLRGMDEGMKGDVAENPELAELGTNIGNALKEQKTAGLMGDSSLTVDIKLIKQGLVNGMKGSNIQMTAEEAQTYLNATMQKLQEKRMQEQNGPNKAAGEVFLKENAKKAGVVTTASGLQYEVIKKGTGALPNDSSRVKVHYHGTLIDGTVFDSSVDRGEPAVFGVNQVIKGWTEALKLMPVGSKYKLYIPQELAYGSQSMGNIKPFSALIFEVELIGIEK